MTYFILKDTETTRAQGISGCQVFSMIDLGGGQVNVIVHGEIPHTLVGPFTVSITDIEVRP